MAFAQIWGNFVLSSPKRQSPIPSIPDFLGFHLHYRTSITCTQGNIPAIVRIYQASNIPTLAEDSVVFLFGNFTSPRTGVYEIEAVNMFPYPSGVSDGQRIVPDFHPRITVVGHVISRPTTATDGTRLFPVNSLAYVRDVVQSTTVVASIAQSKHWASGPPLPEAHSPVHITGPIQCIDRNTRFPVVIVEDITLDVGDREVGRLANEARLAVYYQEVKKRIIGNNGGSEGRQNWMQHEFDVTRNVSYESSSASLSSVPPFPNPRPIPLQRTPWTDEPPKPVYLPFSLPQGVRRHDSFVEKQSPKSPVVDEKIGHLSLVATEDMVEVATMGAAPITPTIDLVPNDGLAVPESVTITDDASVIAGGEMSSPSGGPVHTGVGEGMVYLSDLWVPQDERRYRAASGGSGSTLKPPFPSGHRARLLRAKARNPILKNRHHGAAAVNQTGTLDSMLTTWRLSKVVASAPSAGHVKKD